MLLALHLKQESVQHEFLESQPLLRKHESGHRKMPTIPFPWPSFTIVAWSPSYLQKYFLAMYCMFYDFF